MADDVSVASRLGEQLRDLTQVESMPSSPSALYTEEAHEIICEAYTYGYPLVLMDITRQVMTATVKGGTHRSAINQFAHSRTFSDNTAHGHFGAEADTLQSIAWLNLAKEPIVLSIPDIHERYFTMQMADAWMVAFATLGSRTSGNSGGHFAIVGPGWSGAAPANVQVIESPTSLVRLIGRTQTKGSVDIPSVHASQRQFKLTPLSLWGQKYALPRHVPGTREIDLKATPAEHVARMDASTFFGRLNALMADNPPHPADAAPMRRFATVGVGPGRPFELRDDPFAARSVDGSVRTALARIVVEATRPSGRTLNGWRVRPNNVGFAHTDYMWRAVVALLNPGASVAADAVSLDTTMDADGNRLTGAQRYVIRFAGDRTPPVNGFWSIAMHNSRNTLVHNAIDRHAITSADEPQRDGDGAVTLYIQHDPPDNLAISNWLPAPKDHFNLAMQLHWPQPEILDGTWSPPSVERVT